MAAMLTSRQIAILSLVREGCTNKQIAEVLFISQSTVKNHIHEIKLRLGAKNRTDALITALRKGIIELGS